MEPFELEVGDIVYRHGERVHKGRVVARGRTEKKGLPLYALSFETGHPTTYGSDSSPRYYTVRQLNEHSVTKTPQSAQQVPSPVKSPKKDQLVSDSQREQLRQILAKLSQKVKS